MKPDWTNEETNAAKSLRDSGVPYATIAARLGRSTKGVRRRLEYLKEMAA
jgi:DNA-binding Lrp family transcriptional regulator